MFGTFRWVDQNPVRPGRNPVLAERSADPERSVAADRAARVRLVRDRLERHRPAGQFRVERAVSEDDNPLDRIQALSAAPGQGGEKDRERYASKVIERVLTQYEDMDSENLDYLIKKLRQLAA